MPIEGSKIIIDTDMGPDDTWALILLLRAQKYFNLDIIGITCVHGNAALNHVARNTMRVLEYVNRLDIPVFLGAAQPLLYDRDVKQNFYGTDGFGDCSYETEPHMELIKTENGINALYRLVSENSGNVTIICLGPLTNIALATRMYSDFMIHVFELYIMGGNYMAIGNVTSHAEYNFHQDPEAAYIVLNHMKIPITILPWEAVIKPQLDLTTKWRFDELGTIDSNLVRFLNAGEKVFRTFTQWYPPDFILMAAFINPQQIIERTVRCRASVELFGNSTRGQMLIDHMKTQSDNVTIIELVNEHEIKNLLKWLVDDKPMNDNNDKCILGLK